ncbi:hypothetical protein AA313_de0205234 [Arthrobotrys entomopaga]|nr:hypothetical protein AA313_de0205234 [Arthrobotrys entomopaga]
MAPVTHSNQHQLQPLLLLFSAPIPPRQKQDILPSEPPDYIRPVMSVRRLASMWNDRTRNGQEEQPSSSKQGPILARSQNLRSGDFSESASSPPKTPILPEYTPLFVDEEEISPLEIPQNPGTPYISECDSGYNESRDSIMADQEDERGESPSPPKIMTVEEFGRQLSHRPPNEPIAYTPQHSQLSREDSESPHQSRASELQGQQSAISGSPVVNPFAISPSRIPLPVAGRRVVSVEFPAPSCAVTSETNPSPDSPHEQAITHNDWTYQESLISPAPPRKPKPMIKNSEQSVVDTANLSFDQLRDIYIQSQMEPAGADASIEEYQEPHTFQRAHLAQLPRINTDVHGSSIFYAPIPESPFVETPAPETTPALVNSEIRELKDEPKQTARRLESKIAAVAKDSVPAKPASVDSTRIPGDILEYIEQPKVSRTDTQKSSPISISPEVRAKKIIVMLDATHQYSKPSLRAKKTLKFPPRTNLKRLSDALASENTEDGMRQLVYYLDGHGNSDDNWSNGDEVYIFGFSHGAFAARALAVLLSDIGLFNKPGMVNFEALYETYFDPKYGRIVEIEDFENWRAAVGGLTFEISEGEGVTLSKVGIKLLGCLDTIGWSDFQQEPSQTENERLWRKGFISPRHLLLHENIENAFHALALDENRASHAPMLMFRPRGSTKGLTQVWFTGSHINIGGGQLSHEIASKVGLAKPNRNELSDIVFLWMITQCYEVLTFGKKHVNKSVTDYTNLQAEEDSKTTTENVYKNHWVAAKIDEAWPEKVNFLIRVRQSAGLHKKHVRAPLRYRPHWFKSEPWSIYTSGESVHASSNYRYKFHPTYIPKALVGYSCEKCVQEADPRNPTATAEESGQNTVPKRFREFNYHWEGEETLKDRIFTSQKSLPIARMTAFEILNAGGEGLIKGFELSYKDLYRESPPVFKYTWQELKSMQEGWIFKLDPGVGQTNSPTNRPVLKPASSLEMHAKYRGMKIKAEGLNTIKLKGKKSSKKEKSSKNEENEGTGNTIFGESLLSNSSRVKTEKGLKDESEGGKGKGKHSGHTRESLSFKKNDDKGKLTAAAEIAAQIQELPSIVVEPPPQQHPHQYYQSERRTQRQRYSGEEGQTAYDQAREFNKRGKGRYSKSVRYTDDISDDESLPPVAPLRIPVEPEWARKMKDKGVVHPCKFKKENRD